MDSYERKIRKIKKCIKNYVVENAALCDSIAKIQNTIEDSNSERDFLLRKLIEYEPEIIQQNLNNLQPETKYKKRKNSDSEASSINRPYESKKKTPAAIKKQQASASQPNPRLPVILTHDGITILNYGKIVFDRSAYHTENVIYPVGFKISRVFNNTNYICRILDNGSYPLFEIYRESDPTVKFIGNSSDDVHSELLQAFESTSSIIIIPDGDRFFGLRNKTVMEYLNQLPNAKKLTKLMKFKREDASIHHAFLSDHMF